MKAVDYLRRQHLSAAVGGLSPGAVGGPADRRPGQGSSTGSPTQPVQPHRFYGSAEIDMDRPVKSLDAHLNAVVMELQRTQGETVKLTLEVEAEAPNGFSDADVGVVRDKQTA